MLAQTVVQVLANSTLFTRAYFQNSFFQALTFGDIDPGNDYIRVSALPPGEHRTGPGNQTRIAISREPIRLAISRELTRVRLTRNCFEVIHFFRHQEQVPHILSAYLFKPAPRR